MRESVLNKNIERYNFEPIDQVEVEQLSSDIMSSSNENMSKSITSKPSYASSSIDITTSEDEIPKTVSKSNHRQSFRDSVFKKKTP